MSEVELVDYLAVSGTNCENASAPVGLGVPVASSNLEHHFLSCELLEEAVLTCAGAVKADLIAAGNEVYVCGISAAGELNGCLENEYGGGVVNLSIKCIEVCNGLIGYEEIGAVIVAAIVVSNDLSLFDAGLAEIGVSTVGLVESYALDNNLVTDLDGIEYRCVTENCDDAGDSR